MDFGDLRDSDQPEMSLTLKYLLENPTLLQPPDTLGDDGTCKEDKGCDQNQQSDLTSAYLGPQIWSDMLLSEDLKLEPVDLDELLDPTGIEDEMGDLGLLMSSSPPRPPPADTKQPAGDPALVNYQDIPALMNLHSPEEKHAASPSQYFSGNLKPPACQNGSSLNPGSTHGVNGIPHMQACKEHAAHAQKMTEQQLRDQQFALFADIMTNNQFEPQTPSGPVPVPHQSPINPAKRMRLLSSQSSTTSMPPPPPHVMAPPMVHTPSLQHSTIDPVFPSAPSQQSTTPSIQPKLGEKEDAYTLPPISPIEVRIPSPKCVNYVPNTSDVIISTPHAHLSPLLSLDKEGEEASFDPTTRAFSEEELKPQPIIRKSKKVYVEAENKDGRYWSRRSKNNVAAKRSREARRIKENQIAMRANYLEQENATLKSEVSELRKELSRVMELVRGYEARFAQIRQ